MTTNLWITVLATGFVSSLITLGLAAALFHYRLKARLARYAETFLLRLSESVEQSVERGLLKGVKQIPSTEVLRDTTRTLTRTGGDLLEQGLDLLGMRKPK
jgi:hypothetical protein